MGTSDITLLRRRPTMAQPLLGRCVLLVEDSRFASEAVRLMCQRLGARLRRADCVGSARRHLAAYRPDVVLIDIGLPDGSGLDLIAEMAGQTPRIDMLIAMSGDPALERAALAAGADRFLAKPFRKDGAFRTAVLDLLPQDERPPGVVIAAETPILPDLAAYRDDLARAVKTLNSDGPQALDYVAGFVQGTAIAAGDRSVAAAADDLARVCAAGGEARKPRLRVVSLLEDRIADAAKL